MGKGYCGEGVWGSAYLNWDGLEFIKDDVICIGLNIKTLMK